MKFIKSLIVAFFIATRVTADVTVKHSVRDVFGLTDKASSKWDIDARFVDTSQEQDVWLRSIDPHKEATIEAKAEAMVALMHAKRFDPSDPSMNEDKEMLLDEVRHLKGLTKRALRKRKDRTLTTSGDHAIVWNTCAQFFCQTCGVCSTLAISPGKNPRSICKSVGGQNCCVSWSSYNINTRIFPDAYNACNGAINGRTLSCELHGGDGDSGSVCFSNRSDGCTD